MVPTGWWPLGDNFWWFFLDSSRGEALGKKNFVPTRNSRLSIKEEHRKGRGCNAALTYCFGWCVECIANSVLADILIERLTNTESEANPKPIWWWDKQACLVLRYKMMSLQFNNFWWFFSTQISVGQKALDKTPAAGYNVPKNHHGPWSRRNTTLLTASENGALYNEERCETSCHYCTL